MRFPWARKLGLASAGAGLSAMALIASAHALGVAGHAEPKTRHAQVVDAPSTLQSQVKGRSLVTTAIRHHEATRRVLRSVHGSVWKPRPATYGVYVTKDVPIRMSDGVVLTANVYRPATKSGLPAPGRFPTLLVQTPYNKDVQDPHSDYLVERGYVDVVADVRGAGGSEGTFSSWNQRQQLDGKQLVAWAASQPWSTGRVGLHGESWYAVNQLLTAAQQPPALKAIFPVVPTGDNYRSTLPGGYLTSLFAFDLLDPAFGLTPPGYASKDPVRALETLATRPGSLIDGMNYNLNALMGGSDAYDGPYYHAISPLWLINRIKTPTFLVGGWYDALSQRDGPLLFHDLQARGVPVRLLMGPWYHLTAGAGLPRDGVPSIDELQLRWFDHYVKGLPDPGLDHSAPVTYERLGQGNYETARTWPVPGVGYRRMFLSSGAKLSPMVGHGAPDRLLEQPLSGACSRSTYIGTFGLLPSTPCETDDSTNDRTGLVYDLPLRRSLNLTGPFSAHLYVSTSSTDAFLTLHVEDFNPATGQSQELTSGWDTLSFRALDRRRDIRLGKAGIIPFHPYTRASVEKIVPNRVYDWWIEIRPVAAHLAAGHYLRLSLQPSDAVRFLPTAPALLATTGSLLTIYHSAEYPSMIVVPITK